MAIYRHILGLFIMVALVCTANITATAQSCPPNIDFETGTFNNWTCYTGQVAAVRASNPLRW